MLVTLRSLAQSAGSPSRVTTRFVTTAPTGVTQDRISFPFGSTEQAPHWASPPKPRPAQMQLVVQDVQERRIDARGHPVTETVDGDPEVARHHVTLTSPFMPAAA